MNTLYKFLFEKTGLATALPLNGIRTYIMIGIGVVVGVMPQITELVQDGGSMTDIDFLFGVGAIIVPALLAAGFKKAAVENAKAAS
jgi:hypothetical protein